MVKSLTKTNNALQQKKLPKKYILLLGFLLISTGYLLALFVYQNIKYKDIENYGKTNGVLALCIFITLYLIFCWVIKSRVNNITFVKVNLIYSSVLSVIFIYNFYHLFELGSLCPFPAGETYNDYLECQKKVMNYYNLAFLNYNLAVIFILSSSAIIFAFSKTVSYINNTKLYFSTLTIFTAVISIIPPVIEYLILH